VQKYIAIALIRCKLLCVYSVNCLVLIASHFQFKLYHVFA